MYRGSRLWSIITNERIEEYRKMTNEPRRSSFSSFFKRFSKKTNKIVPCNQTFNDIADKNSSPDPSVHMKHVHSVPHNLEEYAKKYGIHIIKHPRDLPFILGKDA